MRTDICEVNVQVDSSPSTAMPTSASMTKLATLVRNDPSRHV